MHDPAAYRFTDANRELLDRNSWVGVAVTLLTMVALVQVAASGSGEHKKLVKGANAALTI
jgi:hypothetical protein